VKQLVNMNEELLKILEILKEDFEMLQDGRWDLNYSDGSEIQASLDNVEKAINIVKTKL
jgi:cell division septal protein FtsQ